MKSYKNLFKRRKQTETETTNHERQHLKLNRGGNLRISNILDIIKQARENDH